MSSDGSSAKPGSVKEKLARLDYLGAVLLVCIRRYVLFIVDKC